MSDVPYLSEHEGAPNYTPPPNYTPDDETQKTIKLVMSLFEKAKKHREKYDYKWLDNYKMFRGKQWKEQRPSYRHSEVINQIFKAIQSTVPIQTDARPKTEFLPQEPGDYELAEILNDVNESDWVKNNWLMQLTEMIYDANIYGIGMGSMEFIADPMKMGGDNKFRSRDPFYCYPDPQALNVNEEGSFFIYAEPVDTGKLKQEYPDHKDHIQPDLMDLTNENRTDFGESRFRSPVDQRSYVETDSAGGKVSTNKTLKITCYMKSDEVITEESDETDPATGVVVKMQEKRLKYPQGRKICIANGVLLDDGINPYEDGKFPFFKMLNYILPREYYGISEVENLESPQKIFNKLVSFALDVLTLTGNPVWIVDDTANIDEDNLTNEPGLIITKTAGSEVRRAEGTQLQPYVLQMIDRMVGWFDEMAGTPDVSRGIDPAGITAASAIESLQQASQTRIRLKTRLMDAALQEMGQMWLSRTFQFRTAPEIVRLTNNQNATKYFRFSIEPVSDDLGNESRQMVVTRFKQDPESGQYIEEDPKAYSLEGKFDVKVATGSALPFARKERLSIAKELFQLGVIDKEELVKTAEWPNYEAVLTRMKEADMAAQQAQMGMPPGGPGAPPAQPPIQQ